MALMKNGSTLYKRRNANDFAEGLWSKEIKISQGYRWSFQEDGGSWEVTSAKMC
jgi:hypothetical protein